MRTICFLLCYVVTGPVAGAEIWPERPNEMVFPAEQARFVRVVVHESSASQPCIDELEVYGADGGRNLALAEGGGKASAASCLAGYAIHRIEHLNDGNYGNSHSWIAAETTGQWAQIELPAATTVSKVVFSRDREGRYRDRGAHPLRGADFTGRQAVEVGLHRESGGGEDRVRPAGGQQRQ